MKVSQINELVRSGVLPIAYFNSQIIELTKNDLFRDPKNQFCKYYKQNYSRKSPTKLISKIYDLSESL